MQMPVANGMAKNTDVPREELVRAVQAAMAARAPRVAGRHHWT